MTPATTALLTALVVAALLALALRGPSWLRGYVWGALGLLGAVAGAAWALLGRRRPDAPAAPRTIDAAAEGEGRNVAAIRAEHRADVEAVEDRAELSAAEHKRHAAAQFRDGT